jgi:hypothetical protein
MPGAQKVNSLVLEPLGAVSVREVPFLPLAARRRKWKEA